MLLALTLVLQLASPEPSPDPLDARDARNAQARFERMRRNYLPFKPSAGTYGHCDIRVGRFCYWYDSTDAAVEPEHPRIIRARDELLAVLDDVAIAEPTDGWVLGQRVRYLIEAGRWNRAAALSATACGAERWWCDALRATALHVGMRYAEADAAFTAALAAMPAEVRCEWMDLRTTADRALARSLDPLACGDRERVGATLLRLGQPLWLSGGNDLRSEHLARRTMVRIFEESSMPNGLTFGDDSRELVLRYGWSEWFTKYQPDLAAYPSAEITGHTRSPSYYFLPLGPVGDAGVPPGSVAWRLTDSLARSRYAPRHVKRLAPLPYQVARFPRGDSTLVIAAFQVTDQGMHPNNLRQGIGIWSDSGLTITAATSPGRVAIVVPADTVITSIEAHDTTSLHAQRARFPLAPRRCAPAWCLSDLLFVAAATTDSAPDPEVAMTSALAAPRINAGEPLGIYWETHTAAEPTRLTVSLTMAPVRVSVVRRIASRLRLARPVTPVRLHWQTLTRRARQAHQITARLPEGVSGRFLVRLRIHGPGRESLTAEREVVVER